MNRKLKKQQLFEIEGFCSIIKSLLINVNGCVCVWPGKLYIMEMAISEIPALVGNFFWYP